MASVVVEPLMPDAVREAVHADPIWRDRSDFVIAAELTVASQVASEQLWARQLDDHRFEICCIPFFVYDLALGDVVETDATYTIRQVVARSGRAVFRVWFGETFHPRAEIAERLTQLGALVEWSSPNLLAVDAAQDKIAAAVSALLSAAEADGKLTYESGAAE